MNLTAIIQDLYDQRAAIPGLRAVGVARRPSGGIYTTGAGAVVTGSAGANFETFDFTIDLDFAANDWTPLVEQELFASHSAGNSRVLVLLQTSGVFRLQFVSSGGVATNYDLAPDEAIGNEYPHKITVTVDRNALATLYVDGVEQTTVSVAASVGVDIGAANANFCAFFSGLKGVCFAARLFNLVLTASEIAIMSLLGMVPKSLRWGSFSEDYESDFSVNEDGWVLGGNVTVNISSGDLAITTTGTVPPLNHWALRAATLTSGKRYRWTFAGQIAVGLAFDQMKLVSDLAFETDPGLTLNATGAVVFQEGIFTATTTTLYIALMLAGEQTITSTGGQSGFVDKIRVIPVGAVLDVDLGLANPSADTAIPNRAGGMTAVVSGSVEQLNPPLNQSGWGDPTGTTTRTTFATTTVTTELLAERVKGLIDDLKKLGVLAD